MKKYEIWRIVDVNMYNSLLSPEVTLEEDVQDDAQEAAREALWNRFDFKKYSDFVCERAVIELKKLLKRLPSGMRVRYVEGSAEIYSPPYYNYGGDELIFRITACSHRSQKSMQRYLEIFFRKEWSKRILRALLMGKYAELKYHADDLVREIGFPVTEAQKAVWMSNLSDSRGRLLAEERDDFFTIMRIGELPQRTCLNYADGAYRECLLSCFDSNKKFLYATINGRPVARAMLRLTKGSAKKPGDKDTASLQFVDVLNEYEEPVERDVEKLVLFLERCYVSGISMEESEEVKRMFIELAIRKAREIGAEVVLSSQYRDSSASMGFTAMQHYLYISKSKGGKQYLDSLGGSCNVTNEGSYRKEMVMILAGEGGKA